MIQLQQLKFEKDQYYIDIQTLSYELVQKKQKKSGLRTKNKKIKRLTDELYSESSSHTSI